MPKPVWWLEKHAKRSPVHKPDSKYSDPHYRANREARLMGLWGKYRATTRVSLDAMNAVDLDIRCSDGTPLDRLLAWEAVEERGT